MYHDKHASTAHFSWIRLQIGLFEPNTRNMVYLLFYSFNWLVLAERPQKWDFLAPNGLPDPNNIFLGF